jgi:tetratricopeptide (TPR) repeat protein
MLADYSANSVLGRRLSDNDRGVRLLAESFIRDLWCRDGTVGQRHHLQRVIRLNSSGLGEEAIVEATALLEDAPAFAEAWNQRAIAYFVRNDFSRSVRDCHQTLELNAYHFGAAVGMGRCYLEMDEGRLALEAFRRALKLNPNLEGIRAQVVLLEKTLGGK